MIRLHPAMSVAASVFVLAVPAAAQAKTKTVTMGPAPAAAKHLPPGTDVNAFFPSTVTINAGDSVKFLPAGFHNADLPGKGEAGLATITPSGQKAAGVADAAGAPFWFNGQDTLGFNPALFASSFGKTVTYTGAKRVQSGLPLAPKPKPFTVKFTKAGSFTVYCDIHPGMKGTVKVLKKGKAVPTAAQDAAAVKQQFAAATKSAKALATKAQPANTVSVGVAAQHGVEYFGMVPSTLTVAAGTPVKFVMSKGSFESHTVTFGPGDPDKEPQSYLGQLAASFEAPVIDPRATYPSDVAPVSLTPALHGNGFWSSGVLDTVAASSPPSSSTVTFGAPGTYKYYCLIHPFMVGSIVVK